MMENNLYFTNNLKIAVSGDDDDDDDREIINRGRRHSDDISTSQGVVGVPSEWMEVNRKLRLRALAPVKFSYPVESLPIPSLLAEGLLVLDHNTDTAIRGTILTLLDEADRRHTLIQDLITNNNTLKDDMTWQKGLIKKSVEQSQELERMLQEAKHQLEGFKQSDSTLNQTTLDNDKLREINNNLIIRCQHLEERSHGLEEELDRTKHKLKLIVESEERRVYNHKKVFHEFKKRNPKSQSTIDQKVLDLIGYYETQLKSNQDEISFLQRVYNEAENESSGGTGEPSATELRYVIKRYDNDMNECKKKLTEFQDQNGLLKMELESRPTVHEHRRAQQRIHKLEKTLSRNNIRIPSSDDQASKSAQQLFKPSFRTDDIDQLPVTAAREYLKAVCEETHVTDLRDMIPVIQKSSQALQTNPKMHQFIREVMTILDNKNVSVGVRNRDRKKPPSTKHDTWCSKTQSHYIPQLEQWSNQLVGLEGLLQSVNNLVSLMMPSQQFLPSPDQPVTVKQLQKFIDIVTEQKCQTLGDVKTADLPTLQTIVSHFQHLFDVPSMSGVYTRMNDIYTKLTESHNILHAVKDMLGLDKLCHSRTVITSVERLLEQVNAKTYENLKHLLQEEDLDVVVSKLHQYNEFLPEFQYLVNELMTMLDVDSIEKIIPAVRTLQLLCK